MIDWWISIRFVFSVFQDSMLENEIIIDGIEKRIWSWLLTVRVCVSRFGKMGNKKTCLATLLQNELNSDVARFTTHIKPVLQQIRLLTGFGEGAKTCNTALQLVLQQSWKRKLHVLLPVLPKLYSLINEKRSERFQKLRFPSQF